jgi:hypothetical protein
MKLEDFAAQLVAIAGGKSGGGGGGGGAAGSTGSGTAGAAPAGTGGGSPTQLLGGTLSTIIPAIAAYAAAQPQQVTAKVGSGLSLTVTPYALSSDSGAELNVNVTYNENAAATISADATQAQANDDLNSRVSEHEVQTLVRMDALKFFEISTMQSIIARQKAPYKLIDPIVELPLLDGLGVFPNWRRKPEVIHNQSVIFLQATILPTAADLGNSIRVQYDRVPVAHCVSGSTCIYKEARKAEELGAGPESDRNELTRIMEYHRQMVRFFSGQYPGSDGVAMKADNGKVCAAVAPFDADGSDNCLPSWGSIPNYSANGEPVTVDR